METIQQRHPDAVVVLIYAGSGSSVPQLPLIKLPTVLQSYSSPAIAAVRYLH